MNHPPRSYQPRPLRIYDKSVKWIQKWSMDISSALARYPLLSKFIDLINWVFAILLCISVTVYWAKSSLGKNRPGRAMPMLLPPGVHDHHCDFSKLLYSAAMLGDNDENSSSSSCVSSSRSVKEVLEFQDRGFCCSKPRVAEQEVFPRTLVGVMYVNGKTRGSSGLSSIFTRLRNIKEPLAELDMDEFVLCLACGDSNPAAQSKQTSKRVADGADASGDGQNIDICSSKGLEEIGSIFTSPRYSTIVKADMSLSKCYNAAIRMTDPSLLLLLDDDPDAIPSEDWLVSSQSIMELYPAIGALSASGGISRSYRTSKHKFDMLGESCASSEVSACLCMTHNMKRIPTMLGRTPMAYVDFVLPGAVLIKKSICELGLDPEFETIIQYKMARQSRDPISSAVHEELRLRMMVMAKLSMDAWVQGYSVATMANHDPKLKQDDRVSNHQFSAEFLQFCKKRVMKRSISYALKLLDEQDGWKTLHEERIKASQYGLDLRYK